MLIETSLLYLVLAASPAKRTDEEESVCVNSDRNHMLFSVSKSVEGIIPTDVVTAIGRDLSTVSEVRHVMAEQAEGNLLVWVLADKPDAEARERIFRKQFSIIEGFPEISFDFNVISSARSVAEISSSAKMIFTREG